jgi:hypothetical protein
MGHAQNGFCWACVMNQRCQEDAFARDMDQFGWIIPRSVVAWPTDDLF